MKKRVDIRKNDLTQHLQGRLGGKTAGVFARHT
jgi:hypothetical protein